MTIPDYTPAHLVPLPWQRVLMAVRMVVKELWDINKGTLEVRSDTRDDLLLAARYYDKREEFLKRDGCGKSMRIFDINGFLPPGRIEYYSLHILLFIGWAIVAKFALWLLFGNDVASHLDNINDIIRSVSVTVGLGAAYYYQCSALVLSSPKIDPKTELAEIADFNAYFPSVVSMARYEEPTPPELSAVKDLENFADGAPVAPPGLAELLLAKDNDSLRAIRMQLRATRRTDIGMTLVSFGAFVITIALCFWLLVVTDRVSQGLIGIGGSGLVVSLSVILCARHN